MGRKIDFRRKLDDIFSRYVRYSKSVGGYITCYCGKVVPVEESDASHYISRQHLSTRYDERNVHPSCRRCNRFMDGNLPAYTIFLEEKYGNGIVQELYRLKQGVLKDFPYEEKTREYTKKLSTLSPV